jgi:hypothetical protein
MATRPRKRATADKSADDRYSFENAVKFWKSHRVDLSRFQFNRNEANER